MADEPNIPSHRWYQERYHIRLPMQDVSQSIIFDSGIRKIDQFISGSNAPAALFTSGEAGAWYDPSDLTTLFQDSAGTTPVTAAGQPVGLMLDKSKGLALGAELWSDTGVIVGTGWTAASGVYNHTAGVDTFRKDIGLVAGRTYQVTFTVTDRTAGDIYLSYGGSVSGPLVAANGTYTQRVVSGANGLLYFQPSIGFVGSVSGISVKLLAGNHATQATSASRPTYGINPITGTRNLLTFTEQFDNAAWTAAGLLPFGSGSSLNAIAAPNGTVTADLIVQDTAASNVHHTVQTVTVAASSTYTVSAFIKNFNISSGGSQIRLALGAANAGQGIGATFNLTSNTITDASASSGYSVTSSSVESVGNGWFRVTVTGVTSTTSALALYLQFRGASNERLFTGDGTSGVYVWGAQLEQSATATAYQRVTTQYDVTEAGVQSVQYLQFDGVDDGMATDTITLDIDKVQVFAGVRKLSEGTRIIAETSINLNLNVGAFHLASVVSPTVGYNFVSKGSQPLNGAIAAAGNYSAPNASVLIGLGDISGDRSTIRVNGSQVAQSTSDQGTGNYLAYPLYIGRRGGTILPFNGRLYSLIVRFGPNLTDGQITSTETWVNAKTGAF